MTAAPLTRFSNRKGLPLFQRIGITFTVAASLIVLMLILPLGSAGFITEAFAGSTAIFLFNWRDRRDWAAAAVVAAALGAIYKASGAAVVRWIGWDACFPAALYGNAALMTLLYRATGEDEAGRRRLLVLLRNVALIPALCLGSILAVGLDLRLTPHTYDAFLYVFDRSLGFNPSFVMGSVFRDWTALRLTAGLVYNILPVNLCLLCALWLRRKPAGAPDVRLIFIALGVAGFALYQICPAAGPIYLFGRAFPYQPPPASALAMQTVAIPGAPRNAMPSLHVAWCLLVVYNSWRFPWWPLRIYAAICLALTAAATLGLGEHYLIDLIVAVPLSVAIQLAFSAAGRRFFRAGVCLAAVAAWLVVLRTGLAWHTQPLAAWSAAGVTLLSPALMYRAGGRSRGKAGSYILNLFPLR